MIITNTLVMASGGVDIFNLRRPYQMPRVPGMSDKFNKLYSALESAFNETHSVVVNVLQRVQLQDREGSQISTQRR